MNVVVCLKQVPDVNSEIKWGDDMTMQRPDIGNRMNPLDEYTLENILRIKDKNPKTHITVISMGPLSAKKVLKKALSMGVDDAFLLSDVKLAGSDTLATSYALAEFIKEKLGNFDLIMCGQLTSDSSTGQVGPGIAEFLNLPQITYVSEILKIFDKKVLVSREVEDGRQEIEMNLPGVLCLTKPSFEPRIPTIKKIMEAEQKKIPVIDTDELDINLAQIGISGSPTFLSKLSPVKLTKKCKFVELEELKKIIKENV